VAAVWVPRDFVQLRWWTVGIGLFMAGAAIGQESDELRVRLEVAPGHRFVGQEFEFSSRVSGLTSGPEIEPPSTAVRRLGHRGPT